MSVESISIPGLNIPAFIKAIQIPYDTQNVFEIIKGLVKSENYETLSKCFRQGTAKDEGLQALYRERFAPRYPSNDELLTNPPKSLGRILGEHMVRNNITLDFQGIDTSIVDDGGLGFDDYVRQRGLRVHDILHVMLNADTSPIGEGLVGAFQGVQYGAIIHMLITYFMGMHVAFYQTEKHHRWTILLGEAMEAGRKAVPFWGVPWESLMAEDIDVLRERFKITKLPNS